MVQKERVDSKPKECLFGDICEILQNFFELYWGSFLTCVHLETGKSLASQLHASWLVVEGLGPSDLGEGVQEHVLAVYLFGVLVGYTVI